MKDTTIYTYDANNESVYSTTDKLYLAYGETNYPNSYHITVGTNSPTDLNNGLHIDRAYWGTDTNWLRAPSLRSGSTSTFNPKKSHALGADMGVDVSDSYAMYEKNLRPAFEMNMSGVAFASAVPAVASEGNITLESVTEEGALTLRYNADDLGSASVSADKSEVVFTGVPTDTYLIAQNSDGAHAKAVSGEGSVSATDMGISDFGNCKVWLEKTDSSQRMTRATLAGEEQTVYNMELSGEGDFGNACEGYASDKIKAKEFNITNTGNVALSNVQVKVDGTDSDAFALAWDSSVTSVQPDGELKVTVQPKDNLAVKEYRAQISVSADNCTTVSKDLQFEVRKHKFTNYVSNNDATCTEDGTKTATCDFGCGSTDTLSDEGSRLEHRPSDWIIDRDATATVDGKKHKECTVCGTILESESIPATGTPAGAITDDSKTLNKGIKGTWSGSNIRLSWGKVSGATGYEVYGARCGYKYTKVATVKGTTT